MLGYTSPKPFSAKQETKSTSCDRQSAEPITPPTFKAFTLKTSQTCQTSLRHGIVLAPLTLPPPGLGTGPGLRTGHRWVRAGATAPVDWLSGKQEKQTRNHDKQLRNPKSQYR